MKRIDEHFFVLDGAIDFVSAINGMSRRAKMTDEQRAVYEREVTIAIGGFNMIRDELAKAEGGFQSFHGVRFWLVGDTVWRSSTGGNVYEYQHDTVRGVIFRYEYVRVMRDVSPASS